VKFKLNSTLTKLALASALASVSAYASAYTVIGSFDGVNNNVGAGYVCRSSDSTNDTQDLVVIYAGGAPGSGGTEVARGYADMPAYDNSDDSAIITVGCSSGLHRFAIGLLPAAVAWTGASRTINAYHFDPSTSTYTQLTPIGTPTLPTAPPTPGGGGSFPFTTLKNLLDSGQNTVEILFVGDSHTASYGDSWATGSADSSSWVYKLGVLLGAHYTNYKVTFYARSLFQGIGTSTSGAATYPDGTSTCGSGETDTGAQLIANFSGTKNLILVQDGIAGSNLERYLARLKSTAPSTTPIPANQSVIRDLIPGTLGINPDGVIMMFGIADSLERYHPEPSGGGEGCYTSLYGIQTLGGSYGSPNLGIKGDNSGRSFQTGDPYTDSFRAAYKLAITGTQSTFNTLTARTPFIGIMTPINAPGLFYDGRSTIKPGHVGYNNQFCASCMYTVGPLNAQLLPDTGGAGNDTNGWALNLKKYQDTVYFAVNDALSSTATILDLFGWSAYVNATAPRLPSSTNFYEPTGSTFSGVNFDIHLNSTGNAGIATTIYNYGFGLN